MKRLLITIISIGLMIGPAGRAASVSDDIPYYIYNAANQFGIDAVLMLALCTQESHCRVEAVNRNDAPSGKKLQGVREYSHGLFQIKLATARGLGFTGTYKELKNPETNTWYAAKLLRELYDKHHDTLKVLSAYNAGRPIASNKNYVTQILKYYVHYKLDRNL